MQGKLIAVAYTLRTSSLLAEFINKNRCISVRFVSEEVKSIKFENFDNLHNSFLRTEYFIDFLCEKWIPCQAVTSVLCLHYRPETVHCSTKEVYTSEITFFALHLSIDISMNNLYLWSITNILRCTQTIRLLAYILQRKLIFLVFSHSYFTVNLIRMLLR